MSSSLLVSCVGLLGWSPVLFSVVEVASASVALCGINLGKERWFRYGLRHTGEKDGHMFCSLNSQCMLVVSESRIQNAHVLASLCAK